MEDTTSEIADSIDTKSPHPKSPHLAMLALEELPNERMKDTFGTLLRAMSEKTSSLQEAPEGSISKYIHQRSANKYERKRENEAENEKRHEKLWQIVDCYIPQDIHCVEKSIASHLEYNLARSRWTCNDFSAFKACAFSLRDRSIEYWNDTQQYYHDCDTKRLYYLSFEYLPGRSMLNYAVNLNVKDIYETALANFGYDFDKLMEYEHDQGLGSGGLGRLASCFLDSLVTQNYPAWGYGLRYQYGQFRQEMHEGWQVELPDYWLMTGDPWEIHRFDKRYEVRFGGEVVVTVGQEGKPMHRWVECEIIYATAYDIPIPGYHTHNNNNLRLWHSQPFSEFNMESFNAGDYYGALKDKQKSEQLTTILYPNDSTPKGHVLRFKQQYFFASASIQDIVFRFEKREKVDFSLFPEKVNIQLNDTHPTISIPELMRILLDEKLLSWEKSWHITSKTFAFTNHTILPEALESWEVWLFEKVLPRHLQIIYEINNQFLKEVEERFPNDPHRLRRMSIIEEKSNIKYVRMAFLAIIGSFSTNGVARIHSNILQTSVFHDFYELWPEKFVNITNGVTPRRWLANANPLYAAIITNLLQGSEWINDLSLLSGIEERMDNGLLYYFDLVKKTNKRRLKQLIWKTEHIKVQRKDCIYDVQVKRIHEYKRQLMNILGIIHRYLELKKLPIAQRKKKTRRLFIFGGKAAPGYYNAKLIIKLISNVSKVINADPEIGKLLKVVFLRNYNVSIAEKIIPAADISQHISTVGTEASGTSCMKFAMNGSLILGTKDGANIEISDHIGKENCFLFGPEIDEIEKIRNSLKNHDSVWIENRLYNVLTAIKKGMFGEKNLFSKLIEPIFKGDDYYMIAHDFSSYLDAQKCADELWKDQNEWTRRCLLNTARIGYFSSDRSIDEYNKKIWKLKPCPLPFRSNIKKDLKF